jgi:hypothetical protein
MRGLTDRRFFTTLTKSALATALMGMTALLAMSAFSGLFSERLLDEVLFVLLCGGGAGIVFLGTAFILNIEEWRWLLNLVRRKIT